MQTDTLSAETLARSQVAYAELVDACAVECVDDEDVEMTRAEAN